MPHRCRALRLTPGREVLLTDGAGGVGSGVIYDDAGLVLTAHHVVSFGDEVTVRTADDRTFTGRVVGRAPERDLAVVALPWLSIKYAPVAAAAATRPSATRQPSSAIAATALFRSGLGRDEEPKATRRPRLGKSSGASGTRGVVRTLHAVERSRLPPQAGAGKGDSFYGFGTGVGDLLPGHAQDIPVR